MPKVDAWIGSRCLRLRLLNEVNLGRWNEPFFGLLPGLSSVVAGVLFEVLVGEFVAPVFLGLAAGLVPRRLRLLKEASWERRRCFLFGLRV